MINTAIPYRREIDGLRAVAVLAVLMYHINADYLSSGFLGVGVFFVISGYLATLMIYPSLDMGRFSLTEFYNRRLNRLLPAYLSVLIFSWLGANLLFPPEWDYVVFNRELVSSLFFLSNIYLARGIIYFSPQAETMPLLHTWSLSLEVQFYFLFPLLLMGLMYFTKSRKSHLYTLLGILLLLLLVSFVGVPHFRFYQGYDYYLPHRRFVELLLGAVLALATVRRPTIFAQEGLSWLCLLILVLSFFVPSELYNYTKWGVLIGLVPCVATAYLLLPGRSEAGRLNSLLGHPLLVSIGRMSYSLYLWHWPILAFVRYVYGDLSGWAIGCIVLISLGLSIVSYRYIEQRLRRPRWSLGLSCLIYLFVPIVLVGVNQVVRLNTPDPKLELASDGVISYHGQDIQGQGIIGDTALTPSILIVGNSHCLELGAFFDQLGKREGWSAYAISSYVSPFVLGFKPYNPNYHRYALGRNKIVRQQIATGQYKTIILPADWGNETFNTPGFLKRLSKTLQILEEHGLRIYMLNAYADVDEPRYKEYHHRRMGLGWLYPERNVDSYKGEAYAQTRANLHVMAEYLAKYHPRVHWIDLSSLIPDALLLDGKPIYRDNSHFNRHWVEHLATLYSSPWRNETPQLPQ